MDTQNLVLGSRIEHGLHGSGTITFVGTDYLGIAFDGESEALIRRELPNLGSLLTRHDNA